MKVWLDITVRWHKEIFRTVRVAEGSEVSLGSIWGSLAAVPCDREWGVEGFVFGRMESGEARVWVPQGARARLIRPNGAIEPAVGPRSLWLGAGERVVMRCAAFELEAEATAAEEGAWGADGGKMEVKGAIVPRWFRSANPARASVWVGRSAAAHVAAVALLAAVGSYLVPEAPPSAPDFGRVDALVNADLSQDQSAEPAAPMQPARATPATTQTWEGARRAEAVPSQAQGSMARWTWGLSGAAALVAAVPLGRWVRRRRAGTWGWREVGLLSTHLLRHLEQRVASRGTHPEGLVVGTLGVSAEDLSGWPEARALSVGCTAEVMATRVDSAAGGSHDAQLAKVRDAWSRVRGGGLLWVDCDAPRSELAAEDALLSDGASAVWFFRRADGRTLVLAVKGRPSSGPRALKQWLASADDPGLRAMARAMVG